MSNFKTPDTITYWTVNTVNGYGGQSWNTPTVIPARVALVTKEVTNLEGKKVLTSHAIYTRILLSPGTYIALGDESASADPSSVSTAKKVILSSNTNSMSDMSRMMI